MAEELELEVTLQRPQLTADPGLAVLQRDSRIVNGTRQRNCHERANLGNMHGSASVCHNPDQAERHAAVRANLIEPRSH